MRIIDQDLTTLLSLLREKQVSSYELTKAYLDQIEAKDNEIHAFLHVDKENVLKKAELADKERASGKSDKPLLGVPLAVKDIITVEGMPSTAGAGILEGYMPPYTATVVKRLQNAGMIVIGKTNTDAFGMGGSTEFSDYGLTHNPWNLDHVPGGSSGGSAAAVSARFAPVALGTDTGGSVRQPASHCGVSGLKPTYGRVSRNGLIAFGSSLDVCGVFGQSVDDIWTIFENMAGQDPMDMTTSDRPLPDKTKLPKDIKGLKIGIAKEFFPDRLQPEVQTAIDGTINILRGLGAEIIEIEMPHIGLSVPVYYILAPAEASANLARMDGIRFGPREESDKLWDVFFNTRSQRFGDEVKRRIMIGTYVLSSGYYDAYYVQANKARQLIKQDFAKAFGFVDAILTPVAPTSALKIGAHQDDPLAMYREDILTLPPSLAGNPAFSIPVGRDNTGLPIGAQLIGDLFREDVIYQIGAAIQSVTDLHKAVPPLIAQ